jgi:hypothetical protein
MHVALNPVILTILGTMLVLASYQAWFHRRRSKNGFRSPPEAHRDDRKT